MSDALNGGEQWAVDFGDLDLLPYEDEDDVGDVDIPISFEPGSGPFNYIGRALTAEEFAAYVNAKDFGTVPPDFIVLHHTAIPYTLATAASLAAALSAWDAKEAGLSDEQIKQKRLVQLGNMKRYYHEELGWDRGPHLFVDDRFIYLFTDMYEVGIHAKQGNSFRDSSGRLHYSIGIEVIGDYTKHTWPDPVARMVGHAIGTLKRKLNTFDLEYRPFAGGISSHRDYNKPSCPGNAITNSYYITIAKQGFARVNLATTTSLSADSPVLGSETGSQQQALAYMTHHLPNRSEYNLNDMATIVGAYWKHAATTGVDPFLALAHCLCETDEWQSAEAARPHRNPAHLGQGAAPGGVQSFASWDESVRAHLTDLKARGQGKKVRDLYGNEQAQTIVAKAQAMARG